MVRNNPIPHGSIRVASRLVALALILLVLVGCRGGLRDPYRRTVSPVDAGYNTNNLLDLVTQADADSLGNVGDVYQAAERLRKKPTPEQLAQRRSVLCLSGGGCYGAYSAGVLCGWTASGDRPGTNGRPNFSVVTGISTGALIAPYAFLGPRYDDHVRKFFTTIEDRDIYRLRPVRGLFGIALADNTPLANLIDESVTPEIIREVAEEHRKGRRLYIGTTELEGGALRLLGCRGDRGAQPTGRPRTDQANPARLVGDTRLLSTVAHSSDGGRPNARRGTRRRRRIDVDLLPPTVRPTRTANRRSRRSRGSRSLSARRG